MGWTEVCKYFCTSWISSVALIVGEDDEAEVVDEALREAVWDDAVAEMQGVADNLAANSVARSCTGLDVAEMEVVEHWGDWGNIDSSAWTDVSVSVPTRVSSCERSARRKECVEKLPLVRHVLYSARTRLVLGSSCRLFIDPVCWIVVFGFDWAF